jgi:hypothetical protein
MDQIERRHMTTRQTVRRLLGTTLALAVLMGCGDDAGPTDTGIINPPPQDTTPTPPPDDTTGNGDPTYGLTVQYSTYVGGSGYDEAREPVLLSGGRLLFGTRTKSRDAPTTPGALFRSYLGGVSDTWLGILSADGGSLEAGTYFGGSQMERNPYGMEVTSNGDIVVTSGTSSPDIPTTAGAYRTSLGTTGGEGGGYICRLAPTLGTVRWCSYTTGWPRGGLTLDGSDNVIVVGRVPSGADFTATPGAYQTTRRGYDDAFVLKLTSDGSSAMFKTFLGGTGSDLGEVVVSVRSEPNRLILGGISRSRDFPVTSDAPQRVSTGVTDAFSAWLSPDGSTLLYSTILGGANGELMEHKDALMPDGSIVLAGVTSSADLPGAQGSLSGGHDGFVAKLNASGSSFDFVRYIGGNDRDRIIDRVVDSAGRLILVGDTGSRNFPVTAGALQSTFGGGANDAVVVVLDSSGDILYSTYLGGSGDDWVRGVTIGPDGALYLVGATTSDNFPVTSGAYQRNRAGAEDAFVVKLMPSS